MRRQAMAAFVSSALLGLVALLATAGTAAAQTCPNEAFRERQGSTFLPNCRAYEMVSPVDKNGYDVNGHTMQSTSSASGNALGFSSPGAFGDAASAPTASAYLARRGSENWFTTAMMPKTATLGIPLTFQTVSAATPEFTETVIAHAAPSLLGEPEQRTPEGYPVYNLYLHDTATGTYRLITTRPWTHPRWENPLVLGVSNDGSRVLFSIFGGLDPGDQEVPYLYLWDGRTDQILSLTPGTSGFVGASNHPTAYLSPDGSTVVYQTNGGQIIRWHEGTSTVVSQSQAATCSGVCSGGYLMAVSEDGSKVVLSSRYKLTEDSEVNGSGEEDLFRYDAETEKLTDLTPHVPGGAGFVGNDRGTLTANPSASHVYFTATALLVPGKGIEGARNIYLWEEGAPLRFVATARVETFYPSGYHPQQVSDDGRRYLFSTQDHLPGYENAGHNEIYLYDEGSEEVICVSCNPAGTPATGDAEMTTPQVTNGVPFADGPPFRPENLSHDGRRVFFISPEALVKGDTNGVYDLYEWENGTVHLISTGQGELDVSFLGASTNGDNAFFSTDQRLVRQDTDQNIDAYDARVNGGLPAQEPAPSTPCEGESCRPSGPPSPTAAPAGSSLYSGPGNTKAGKRNPPRKHKRKGAHKRGGKHTRTPKSHGPSRGHRH